MKSLRKNNTGATIVVVLVAVVLISMLAATMLYMALAGHQMRMAERHGRRQFYNAETILEEIRVGLQKAASDSIQTAYSRTMEQYTELSDTEAEARFQEYYKTALLQWENDAGKLFTTSAVGGQYTVNPYVIQSFVQETQGVTLQSGKAVVRKDGSVCLKKVSAACVRNGVSSLVESDIVIALPPMSSAWSEVILTALPEYAFIAKNALTTQSAIKMQVNGNAYVGNLQIQDGGAVSISNGTVICKGLLQNHGRFVLGKQANLWTQEIELQDNSHTELAGVCYVADDLTISGNHAQASITGKYYGFGNGTNAESSSAILVNGRDAVLDLSQIHTLMLAGTAFIGTKAENVSQNRTDIQTGESILTKSSQLAYLVPADCTTVGKNPVVYTTTGQEPDAGVDFTKPLWGEGAAEKTLGSYFQNPNSQNIQTVYYAVGNGQFVRYLYMKFDTAEQAASYFRDYFTYRKEDMETYLKLYGAQVSVAAETAGKMSTGNLVYYDGESATLRNEQETGKPSESNIVKNSPRQFANLCQTLNSSMSGKSGQDAYDFIVNTKAIQQYTSGSRKVLEFKSNSQNGTEELQGMVINGDYTINEKTANSVCFIIATGNVNVNRDFQGLIISGGTITARKDLIADSTGVTEAMRAKMTASGTTVSMQNFLYDVDISGGGSHADMGSITWNLQDLVSYERWTAR